MRTSEAVTPLAHLSVPFWTFAALYVFLAAMVAVLLWRQILHAPPPGPAGGAP
jgi:cytochrome d ubiquinol oxidase subunit I